MKKIIVALVLLLALLFSYISSYKIPELIDENTFEYKITFLNPFKSDDAKAMILLEKLASLSDDKSEVSSSIKFEKVMIKLDTAKVYMSGTNEAASSYNELRIIAQIEEVFRINFDYIKKIIIIDSGNLFKHVDVRFPFRIRD